MNTKSINRYVLTLYAVSWAIQLLSIYTSKVLKLEDARMWLLAGTMLTPTIITLLFLRRNPEWRSYLLLKPNRHLLSMSFWSIVSHCLLAFGTVFMVLQLSWGTHPWFHFSWQGVEILGGPWVLGKGPQNWLFFLGNGLATALVFALLNGIVATGEEFAWRGFLQNVLIEKLGLNKALFLTGLIWSFWHLPIFLAGHNEPEHPVLGAFILAPIRLVALSFFWGWLTLRCRSFIPAALAHAALNSIQEGVVGNLELSVGTINRDVMVLILTIGLGVLGALMLRKDKLYGVNTLGYK